MRHFILLALLVTSVTSVTSCAYGINTSPPEVRGGPGDGLARTPPMGWSSWNSFACEVTESLILEQADAMLRNGMADLGYRYVNIDDCWQASKRDDQGALQADPRRFPHGIAAIADYLHARGLFLGIYSSPGKHTCDWMPGSHDHEEIDARTFAAWGVDYVKFDRCFATLDETLDGFVRMHDAIVATGRPMVLSINPNGATWDQPWSDVAHLWRTTPDIKPVWSADCSWWCGIREIAEINGEHAFEAHPGAWNDPDMLEVGVVTPQGSLTTAESRTHMTLWAMMAAPLIAGADLVEMSDDAAAMYTNAELVAIDQDPLGVQGWRVRDDDDGQVWVKRLADGGYAVALVNLSDEPRTVTAWWTDLGVGAVMKVRDVWAGVDLGAVERQFPAELAPHDSVLLRVGS